MGFGVLDIGLKLKEKKEKRESSFFFFFFFGIWSFYLVFVVIQGGYG